MSSRTNSTITVFLLLGLSILIAKLFAPLALYSDIIFARLKCLVGTFLIVLMWGAVTLIKVSLNVSCIKNFYQDLLRQNDNLFSRTKILLRTGSSSNWFLHEV